MIATTGVFLAMNVALSAQSPENADKSMVPPEVRERLTLYFDLLRNEGWDKMYEIEDWPTRDRDEYTATHIKFKGNTYSSVAKVLKVGLNDVMKHYPDSKRWSIEGCVTFIDRDRREVTSVGSVEVSSDPKRGWIVRSFMPILHAEGWRQCKSSIEGFPIQI